jgi:carboxypeptidase Q
VRLGVVLAALAACDPLPMQAKAPAWEADTSTLAPTGDASVVAPYRATADKIIAAARASRRAHAELAELTDTVGHRLSGSPELDRAIVWAQRTMKAAGLEVHTEKVMVPHWVRGAEDAAIVSPVERPLAILGLGGSIATPKGGLTAPVVIVHDWKELEAKRDRIPGAIVVYDAAMPAWTDAHGSGYGDVVPYRSRGAIAAAKYGAIAVLVRSVTAHSLHTPHTGSMHYDEAVPKIPAAAITVEDAELLARLAAKGPVSVHLHLDAQTLPDVESANTIGELRGKDLPDEVVVLGAHLDSWDVGQGAHDDGAGVVTVIEAAHVLAELGLHPRRTIRVVLFTNEENGLRGGKTYAADHAAELPRHVLAVEADSGGFSPRSFGVEHVDSAAKQRMRPRVAAIAALLAGLGMRRIDDGDAGADLSALVPAGVPEIGLVVANQTYFDVHHTEADTLDKVDPAQLADDVAAVAVLAFIVADAPARLDAR